MISLAFVISSLISGVTAHELKTEIHWNWTRCDHSLTIKSVQELNYKNVDHINLWIDRIGRDFKVYYGKDSCAPGPLEIRIITRNQINNKNYFETVYNHHTVFGRYYGMRNILYMVTTALNNNYILKHELTHYMFDECGFILSEEKEHEMIDDFLQWSDSNDY